MVFDAEIFETNVLSQSSLETSFLGKDDALTKSSSISISEVDLLREHSDRSLAESAINPIHRRDRIETPIITTQPTFDSLTGLDANTPLVAASAATKTYYISPNGSDRNIGTINKPFATIQKAHDLARPGDTIYVRGGTYKLPKNKPIELSKDGTKDNPIKLFAYRTEKVILDASNWSRLDANGNNMNAVVIHTGDYWHVKGIGVTGGPWTGYLAAETSYNKWERLNIYGNDNTGFTLYGDRSTNNLILNSDFHHNYDPLEYGQDADGLAVKFGSGTGNIIRGVRSFANSDDGIDLWEFRSPVTIENTWSYKNGYDLWGAGDKFEGNGNGYKLGGGEDPIPAVNHIVRRSLAWGNATSGFEDNGNPGSIKLYNNTSFNNGSENYQLKWGNHVLRNNISIGDSGVDIAQRVDDVKNSWTLPVTVNKDDFASLNSNVAEGTRVNGQLPISAFLKLKGTSALVDAGVNIGLSFKGSAPDLGAYETNPQAANKSSFLILTPQSTADSRTYPQSIKDNLNYLETLPFDGVAVDTFTGWTLMNGTARSYNEIAADFAPLKDVEFKKFKHNFAKVYVTRPADLFDDWSVTIANFKNLAKVLKDVGFKGVFFDNEEYFKLLWNYPDDVKYKNKTIQQYYNQSRLRGRQIMQAMTSVFPDINVMVYHGAYTSSSATPDYVRRRQTGWDGEELRGAFTVGLFEGKGNRGTVIDGGEVYAYRNRDDFSNSYNWRKYNLPSEEVNAPFIPASVRPRWDDDIRVGFGVYNYVFPEGEGLQMNPNIMRSTLTNALSVSDSYVWLYTEDMNWFKKGAVSDAWIDAVADARSATRKTNAVLKTASTVDKIALETASTTDEVVKTYKIDYTNFTNPERGFHAETAPLWTGEEKGLLDPSYLQDWRKQGISVYRFTLLIDEFKNKPISQKALKIIDASFDQARDYGFKVMPAIMYSFGDDKQTDAPLERVLQHINQLAPIFQENSDVITHLAGGFIGPWGEWHSSTNGLLNANSGINDKSRQILDAILNKLLPSDRMMSLRRVTLKQEYTGSTAHLTIKEAFTGTNKARLGATNGCFLVNRTDAGTYPDDDAGIEATKNFLYQDNLYVPQDGETCGFDGVDSSAYTGGKNAIKELQRMRWSILNNDYHPDVIQRWKDEGYYDQIARRLGYRFRLVKSTLDTQESAGGTLDLDITMENRGFASPFNPRRAEIVLRHETTGKETKILVKQDARLWFPQPGQTKTLSINAKLPNKLAVGDYKVFLNLPDPESTLYNRPVYSIRLANQGVWEGKTGYNDLKQELSIA